MRSQTSRAAGGGASGSTRTRAPREATANDATSGRQSIPSRQAGWRWRQSHSPSATSRISTTSDCPIASPSEPDELRHPRAMRPRVARGRRVRPPALEPEVQVVLPRESDAAEDLQRRRRHAPAGVRRVRLGHRRGERRLVGRVVERPGAEQHRGARALGLEQHLRARVRDGLEDADRTAELLAIARMLDRHLHRPLRDADRLGRHGDGDDVAGARERAALPARERRRGGALERHRGDAARRVEARRGLDAHAVAVQVDQRDLLVAGGDDEDIRARRIGDRLERAGHRSAVELQGGVQRRNRPPPLALGDRRQPLGPLLRGAGRPDRERRGDGRQQRRRRERVAELLLQDGQLHHAESEAAVVLGDHERRPAELGDRAPLLVGEAALVLEREPPDLLGRIAAREELASRLLDRLLVVGELEPHRILGSPSTRSATMFLRISVVPPSIEFARARRKRYVQRSSSSTARPPRNSIASSVSAWLTSAHCHLPSDPSGPGTPVRMMALRPRRALSLRTWDSMYSWASRSRMTASSAAPLSRASSSSSRSVILTRICRPNASVARSCISVVIATAHPLPSPPTMISSGIRASSMNSSLNSASPVIWRSGRTWPASCSMSIKKYVSPLWRGASASVRATSMHHFAW